VVFSILGQVTTVVWLVLILLPGPNGATALWQSDNLVGFMSYLTFVLAGAIILFCVLYAVIQAALIRRWGWFVGLLLGTIAGNFIAPGVASIAFGLWGPTTPPNRQRR